MKQSISNIKILLADDHAMVREGLQNLLERQKDFQVVGEASDGHEAIQLVDELVPDVVLMDVGMPGLNGLEATRQIKARHPDVAVLILTIHDEEEYICGLLEAGASGYLVKSAYGQELVHAVRAVVAGEFVLHPTAGRKLIERAAAHRPKPVKLNAIEHLTPREVMVLQLVGQGLSNRNIADEMGICVRTVKGHLINVFEKLEVASRTEAVVVGVKQNLIKV